MVVERYDTAAEARAAGKTYHLTPEEVWRRQQDADTYVSEAFDQDGFIHATNGLQPLLQVANMFYRADHRTYLALLVDVPCIQAEVRYDDAEQLYPHIYGPLNVDAVVGELGVVRSTDGTFLDFVSGV